MVVDNTHTKYLQGKDKKAWGSYKDALKAQMKLENFLGGIKAPKLKKGEVYDIPVNKIAKNVKKSK